MPAMTAEDIIERTAIHMSEAGADWPRMTPALRDGWRLLARRAADVLCPGVGTRQGQLVPDEHLMVSAKVVLARHAGKLTTRRADETTREFISRDLVAQLRLCGYRITFGPGAPHHSTPAGPRGES